MSGDRRRTTLDVTLRHLLVLVLVLIRGFGELGVRLVGERFTLAFGMR